MSDNDITADAPANPAPKKPRAKKAATSTSTGAAKAATTKRTASSKTATPAKKRTAAEKPPIASEAAAPSTAMAVTSAIPSAIPSVVSAPSSALGAAADKVSAMIPENMTGKAKDVAVEVKDKASDAVQSLARIISDSAGAIDDNVGPKYGDYARSAAQSVSEAADRLRAKPVDEIAQDTREFVRTKPAAALGIAAVASLLLARIFGSVFGKKR